MKGRLCPSWRRRAVPRGPPSVGPLPAVPLPARALSLRCMRFPLFWDGSLKIESALPLLPGKALTNMTYCTWLFGAGGGWGIAVLAALHPGRVGHKCLAGQ